MMLHPAERDTAAHGVRYADGIRYEAPSVAI